MPAAPLPSFTARTNACDPTGEPGGPNPTIGPPARHNRRCAARVGRHGPRRRAHLRRRRRRGPVLRGRRRPGRHPAGHLQAGGRAGEGTGGGVVHPDPPRRPPHPRWPGLLAARPGPAAGRGTGRRLGAARPPRAAGRRDRHPARPGGPAARVPPGPSADPAGGGAPVRRPRRDRGGANRRRRRVVPRRHPARGPAARRHRGGPGLRRARPAAHRAAPCPGRRGHGDDRAARRAPDLDARPRPRHGMDRVLRRSGRRVRAQRSMSPAPTSAPNPCWT